MSEVSKLQALVQTLEADLVATGRKLQAARRSLSFQRHAEHVARSLQRVSVPGEPE